MTTCEINNPSDLIDDTARSVVIGFTGGPQSSYSEQLHLSSTDIPNEVYHFYRSTPLL